VQPAKVSAGSDRSNSDGKLVGEYNLKEGCRETGAPLKYHKGLLLFGRI
jgi:hypothetical protein